MRDAAHGHAAVQVNSGRRTCSYRRGQYVVTACQSSRERGCRASLSSTDLRCPPLGLVVMPRHTRSGATAAASAAAAAAATDAVLGNQELLCIIFGSRVLRRSSQDLACAACVCKAWARAVVDGGWLRAALERRFPSAVAAGDAWAESGDEQAVADALARRALADARPASRVLAPRDFEELQQEYRWFLEVREGASEAPVLSASFHAGRREPDRHDDNDRMRETRDFVIHARSSALDENKLVRLAERTSRGKSNKLRATLTVERRCRSWAAPAGAVEAATLLNDAAVDLAVIRSRGIAELGVNTIVCRLDDDYAYHPSLDREKELCFRIHRRDSDERCPVGSPSSSEDSYADDPYCGDPYWRYRNERHWLSISAALVVQLPLKAAPQQPQRVRRPLLPLPSCFLAFMTHNDCFYNSSDDDMLELLRALDYHTANESDVDD